jgi:uncharacterized membrane protein YbhN (UPF0104 family)
MSARWWRWVRPLVGALVLGGLVAAVGGRAVVDGLRSAQPWALGLGALVALATTYGAAWRWRLVAGRLDLEVPMPTAMAAYYRSQFLNLTLPGGVLGDVRRGVQHGRRVDDVPGGLRVVAWERTAGQVVLVAVTLVGLAVARPFSAPVLREPAQAGAAGAALFLLALVAGVSLVRRRPGSGGRVGRVLAADARLLLAPDAVLGVTAASLLVVAGHVLTFVVAARAVGVRMPVTDLVPVVLLVLLVSALPVNLAGWGPREGVCAWAFGAAGLGAAQGLATAVAYGAIVFVATLPGAALLLIGRRRGRRGAR